MTIRLYFDEDSMRHALVHALRSRGVGMTAIEAQNRTGAAFEVRPGRPRPDAGDPFD